MIGAIKIKDALFIGDELAAQDLEFVISNKVSHVVNCAGREIPNHWEAVGIEYLTFYWVDQDNQVLFDPEDNITNEILNFIDEALQNGESCLIHSIRGQSRASVALSVYFMQKYRWSLYKTLEFLNSRRPDLEIRASFVSQLADFEQKLIAQNRGPQTGNWNEVANTKITLDKNLFFPDEELLLRNTFLNAQMGARKTINPSQQIEQAKESSKVDEINTSESVHQSKLKWIDNETNNKKILRTNNSEDDLCLKATVVPIEVHRQNILTKSIIKPPPLKEDSPKAEKSFDNPHVKKVIEKEKHPHCKSFKQKNEPLIINDVNIDEDDDLFSAELKREESTSKERMIEKFNSGNATQKFFVPRKDQVGNNTEPVKSKKKKVAVSGNESFLNDMEMLNNPNQTQKFVAKKNNEKLKSHFIQKDASKLLVSKSKDNDDSQSNSQKDVIIRRIKKKNENSKSTNSYVSIGFGHKKSNSEIIADQISKKKSFKNFKPTNNTTNFEPNKSMKRPKPHTRGEFKSQHYKKALDKFQEFKKEQQLVRKNTPVTKFRKGSAKNAAVSY